VTRIIRYLPLVFLLAFTMQMAQAQSGVDFAVGFGSAHDSALSNGGIDSSTGLGCTVGSANPNCIASNSLGGFFLGIGGNLMLWKHFGVGASVNLQPAKQNYSFAQARTTLYDFDGIYRPFSTPRVAVDLMGGIGGANTKFYLNSSYCDAFAGCSSYSQYFESSNHFSVNGGIGANIYVKGNIFIRPEVKVHYVHNFYQYNSNVVPQYMVWLGYSFGNR
jgi:hypothetical protein